MKRLTPLKAIRTFCIECAGTWKEVKLCTANPKSIEEARKAGDKREYDGCPLYEYRLGHNPAKKGQGPKSPKFEKKTAPTDSLQGENNLWGGPGEAK